MDQGLGSGDVGESALGLKWNPAAKVLVIAAAYFVAGKLALLMAIPPGYATAVWPAAGVALTALLTWGARYWPAVALGSFLVNSTTTFDLASATSIAPSAAVCVAIGLGAALQAATASVLIQRLVGFPTSLSREWDVIQLLWLGGPLSCLVSASVGVGSLLIANKIALPQVSFSWWTWWVGDTIGVMLVTPIALIWMAEPRAVGRARRRAVAVPLLVCATLVIAVFVYVSRQDERRIRDDFALRTERLMEVVRHDLTSYAETIQSIRSFAEATEHFDRASFRRFVSRTLTRHPGIQALGWSPLVPLAERARVEADARAEGFHQFQIWQLGPSRAPVRVPDRPDYVVPLYLEPLVGNQSALGFDIASDPVRKRTLERAVEENQMMATPRVELVQSSAPEAGVVVYLPVFSGGDDAPRLRGFASGVFRVARMMSSSLKGIELRGVDLQLLDLTDPRRPVELWSSRLAPAEAAAVPLRIASRVTFCGRQWVLTLSPGSAYAFLHRAWYAWAVLALGLLFTSLLGAFLLVVTGRAAAVEQQVAQQTAALSQRERELAQIILTAHDAFVATDAKAQITAWNPQAEAIFGFPRSEALGRDFIDTILAPEQRSKYREALHLFTMTGHGQMFEQLVESEGIDRGGRRFPMEMTMSPVKGSNGEWTFNTFMRDISAKKESERRMLNSLKEKEVLLKEIHHRVKNNLQVVSSLLSLQALHQPDPNVRNLFADSQARVHSLALIHEVLYRSENLARVNFDAYVRAVLERLAHVHSAPSRGIRCELVGGGVELPVDLAIPCGLIVNELVTNALKYAFPAPRQGTITVSLTAQAGLTTELTVADDGVGLPEGLDPEHTSSLGLDLVCTFAEQIGARMRVEREHGTRFCFVFQREKR